jgi:glycosyltransferase involved in cell wall biosynthesis
VERAAIRVSVVMDHPAQQFVRGLQVLSALEEVDLNVLYGSVSPQVHDKGFDREVTWDVDLLEGYSASKPPHSASMVGRLAWLRKQLRAGRPQVVLCYGWAAPIARATILLCLLSRTPLLLYGDSTWQHSSLGRHGLIRSLVLRQLMRICAGAVSTGTFNREFYIQHGMDPLRIWPGVCPADTEMFGQARSPECGMPGNETAPLKIGFAGKLIPRKGADVLLRAAALLPTTPPWSLTIVGAGPLMEVLQGDTADLGVGDRVMFHGFANTTEMPKLLAGFDVVVVPSRLDMRVLVTIEAMAAGAVIVVSDATAVWGPGDLVQDGVTGLVHASGDPADLARQLRRLLDDRHLLATLQRNGVKQAADFGPEAFARTMAAAAHGYLSA